MSDVSLKLVLSKFSLPGRDKAIDLLGDSLPLSYKNIGTYINIAKYGPYEIAYNNKNAEQKNANGLEMHVVAERLLDVTVDDKKIHSTNLWIQGTVTQSIPPEHVRTLIQAFKTNIGETGIVLEDGDNKIHIDKNVHFSNYNISKPGFLAYAILGVYAIALYVQHLNLQHTEPIIPDNEMLPLCFVTESKEKQKTKCYVYTQWWGVPWLRRKFHNGPCVDCIHPKKLSSLPSTSLTNILPKLHTETMTRHVSHAISDELWLFQSPDQRVSHAFSHEDLKTIVEEAGFSHSFSTLTENLNTSVDTEQYSKDVTVVFDKDCKCCMARLAVPLVPNLPSIANVVSMNIRKHRDERQQYHVSSWSKSIPFWQLHNLCYHVKLANGDIKTQCMVSPREFIDKAYKKSGRNKDVDIGGMLQIYRGKKDDDYLWHVLAFVPERSSRMCFAH